MVKQPAGWQLVTSPHLAGCLYSWKLNPYGQTASRLTTCHQPAAGRLLVLLKIKPIWSNSWPADNLSPARSWLAACTESLWSNSQPVDNLTPACCWSVVCTLENYISIVKQPACWHKPAAGHMLALLKLNLYGQTAGWLTTCHQPAPGQLLVLL